MRKTNGEGYSDPTAYEGLKRASSASERYSERMNGGNLPNGCYYDKNGQVCGDLVYRPDGIASEYGDIKDYFFSDQRNLKKGDRWSYKEDSKDPDLARLNKTLKAIFLTCELAGFEVEGRIYLKDKKTGKVWR